MTRSLFMALLVVITAFGCATQGDRWPLPSEVATSGTGPFRRLADSETGVPGLPLGRVIPQRSAAIESATPVEDRLLYVIAERNDLASPEALPESWVIDPMYFGPRRIFISPPSTGIGYESGSEVEISASADFSFDSDVFDPWIVRTPDDSFRLFFVTSDGVFTAISERVEGPYSQAAQLVAPAEDDQTIRRPAVVSAADSGYLLYLSAGDAIAFIALDDDFNANGTLTLLDTPPAAEIVDDSPEVAVRNPAAIWVRSPTGRDTLRMYFESHREDGSVRLGMMASADGLVFERFLGRVYDDSDNPTFPAPIIDADLATRLVFTRDHIVDNVQYRAPVAAVTPGAVTYSSD